MNWIKTSDQLPERQEGKIYSQVPCLVVKAYPWKRKEREGVSYQTEILVFNHEHKCWDQEDGDDYDCDIETVKYWMKLPEVPQELFNKN